MSIVRRIRDSWRRRQRKVDVELLWPSFRDIAEAHGLAPRHALNAFMLHVQQDPAWDGFDREDVRAELGLEEGS
ncbi:MAG: hypothetical protein ACLFWG_10180 [Longimicrobiales bacterium]